MAKTPATPKTFEEFATNWSGWVDGAIEKVTHNHAIRGSSEHDDIKQLVFLRLLETGHVEKFDVTKGSFTHHIYRVVLHVVSNLYDRNTRNPLAQAIPVIEAAPSEGLEDLKALVLENFAPYVTEGFEGDIIKEDYLNKFESHLATKHHPWGALIQMPDGSSRQRSLALVFRLMRSTLDVKDVAKLLHVTTGSVFSYIKKIKAEAEAFRSQFSVSV